LADEKELSPAAQALLTACVNHIKKGKCPQDVGFSVDTRPHGRGVRCKHCDEQVVYVVPDKET
jgi:hypothetical protein